MTKRERNDFVVLLVPLLAEFQISLPSFDIAYPDVFHSSEPLALSRQEQVGIAPDAPQKILLCCFEITKSELYISEALQTEPHGIIPTSPLEGIQLCALNQ